MDIYKPKVFDFETSSVMFQNLADYLQDRIVDIQADNGSVRLAFSGGRSTVPIFEKFSKQSALPWDRVEFYQTDERYILPDHPESNQKTLKDSLGKDFVLELGELNVFDTNLPIDMTIKNYQEKLDNLDGKYFDIVVLGVGKDGHIASLFPFGNYLKHLDNGVIQTIAPKDFAVENRVSLTVESLLNSEEVILVISGEEKSLVLPELLEGGKKAVEFPAKFLLAHPSFSIYHNVSEK